MSRLYSIAIEVVTWLVLVPFELARIAIGRSSLAALRERLGAVPEFPGRKQRRLLVHAVSAGEMSAASALVHEMATRGWSIVLSAGNEDAHVLARRIECCHSEVERVLRFPWDRPAAMRRLLSGLRPDAVVVMETELWPGLFGECRALGIPLVIAGARIERAAAARYRLARPLFRRMLEGCSAILAINEEEAERFAAIGAPREKIVVAGELKAEACLSSHDAPVVASHGGAMIVAGSTHPGEEEIVLAAFARVREANPEACLVLAPRHVRRSSAIRSLARGTGITVIDRMGELSSLYRDADIVIVGGTFVPVGGHDLFDPARAGRAIVIGPHVDNIRAIATAMRNEDAVCATNARDLGDVLIELLRDGERRRTLGNNALRFAEGRRGVAKRSADRIEAAMLDRIPYGTGPLAALIRKWETLHSYNFVRLLEVIQPVDPQRLAESAGETLAEMLGIRTAVPLRRGIDVEADLARPFGETDAPVRIGSETPSRWAFTFRHACFDGAGAALFVQRTLRRALGEQLEPLSIAVTREGLSVSHLVRSVRDLLRMRHVASRGGATGESPVDRVRFIDSDAALLERLRAEADAHRATVNDVLAMRLATAMRRVGPVGPGRRTATSISIAVGMRRELEPFTRDVAVAWFPVFAGDRPSLDSIREQTTREKRTRAWTRSRTEMRVASLLWPWIAPRQRARYLARQYVVTAGLTTLRVEDMAGVSSYRGAVSTGPVAPLVVTALIQGERLSLAVTWKASRFRDDEIDVIADTLVI